MSLNKKIFANYFNSVFLLTFISKYAKLIIKKIINLYFLKVNIFLFILSIYTLEV